MKLLPLLVRWRLWLIPSGCLLLALWLMLPQARQSVNVLQKPYLVDAYLLQQPARWLEFEALAEVQAAQPYTLISYFDSWVDQVLVQSGERVQAGQLLLRLNRTRLDTEALTLQTQLKTQQLELSQLQQKMLLLQQEQAITRKKVQRQQTESERAQALFSRKVLSQSDLDKQTEQQEMQRLELARLDSELSMLPLSEQKIRQQLALLQHQLQLVQQYQQQSELRAPADALVLERLVHQGTNVQTGTALLQLANLQDVQLTMNWPASLPVQAAAQARAVVWLQGKAESLRIGQLLGGIHKGEAGRRALLLPANPAADWIPGDVLQLRLQIPAPANSFVVPVDSLYHGQQLYKIDPVSSMLQQINVEVLGKQYLDQQQYQLVVRADALQLGDQLLQSRLAAVAAGVRVQTNLTAEHSRPDLP